jgi:hypothetical protein
MPEPLRRSSLQTHLSEIITLSKMIELAIWTRLPIVVYEPTIEFLILALSPTSERSPIQSLAYCQTEQKGF